MNKMKLNERKRIGSKNWPWHWHDTFSEKLKKRIEINGTNAKNVYVILDKSPWNETKRNEINDTKQQLKKKT